MKTIINGIEISSPERLIYKDEKISKANVAKYYKYISNKMMPYVSGRIMTSIRCHDGINGDCFFKKHPNGTSKYIKTIDKNGETYFYITTPQGLIQEVQYGTVEFHIGGSRLPKIDNPDYMVFDLDPDTELSLDSLKEGVIFLKKTLENLGLTSFLKTSGGKGYHIVVPFSSAKNWERFSLLSKQIALLLEAQKPKLFTTNIRKNQRNGKIFVDYLRNDENSTCVAPYSLRARAGAPISMPIAWNALNTTAPNQINIFNVTNYTSNPWKDFFDAKQTIK